MNRIRLVCVKEINYIEVALGSQIKCYKQPKQIVRKVKRPLQTMNMCLLKTSSTLTTIFNTRCALVEYIFFSGYSFGVMMSVMVVLLIIVMVVVVVVMVVLDTILNKDCKFMLNLPKETRETLCGIYTTRGEIMVGIITY
jgi:uncharacterized membrane protein